MIDCGESVALTFFVCMAWHGVNRTNIFSLIFLGLPGIGVPMGFWVR
jgi:hypothetical protein